MRRTTLTLTAAALAAGMSFTAAAEPAAGTAADPAAAAVAKLQHEWDVDYYQVPQKQRGDAFKKLAAEAHQVSASYPGRAEPLAWEAIILSSYAKYASMFSALGLVKQARDLLVKAEKIDPSALHGGVYASLGSLYYKVPAWPIGFGDDEKAAEYLKKALNMDPSNIDNNYFYGDFMMEQKNYKAALVAFKKALAAPARPGRAIADAGRRAEIRAEMKEAESKM